MKSASLKVLSLALVAIACSCQKAEESAENKGNKTSVISCPRVAAIKEQKQDALYKVSTYAGANEEPIQVVNGVLCKARFNITAGIVIAKDGTQFIADVGHHNIRKISKDGIVSTFAGSPIGGDYEFGFVDGVGIQARFASPWEVLLRKDGTFMIIDAGNGAIRMITPEAQVTTYLKESQPAGIPYSDGPLEQAQFGRLEGIAESPANELYIMDGHNTVRRISNNMVSTFAGQVPENGIRKKGYQDGPKENALFERVTEIDFDDHGSLYLCDFGNKKIRKIKDGNVTTLADLEANTLVVDDNGTIYAANNSIIYKISPEGQVTPIAGSSTAGYKDGIGLDARFNYIRQMAIRNGKLFVTDVTTIRKINIK